MHSLTRPHRNLLQQEVIHFPQDQYLLLLEPWHHFGLGLNFDQPS